MIFSTHRFHRMKKRSFIMGALAGAAAGTAAGVLLAPKSGKETRREIKGTLKDIKNEVMDEVKKMGEVTKSKYNKVVSGVVSGYEEAQKITPEQAREIADILDESFSKVQEAAKRAARRE